FCVSTLLFRSAAVSGEPRKKQESGNAECPRSESIADQDRPVFGRGRRVHPVVARLDIYLAARMPHREVDADRDVVAELRGLVVRGDALPRHGRRIAPPPPRIADVPRDDDRVRQLEIAAVTAEADADPAAGVSRVTEFPEAFRREVPHAH